MEDPTVRPPPLPPKSRKSPPITSTGPAATVLTNYNYNNRNSISYPSHNLNNHEKQDTKTNTHVVKIQINPSQDAYVNCGNTNSNNGNGGTSVTCVVQPCIKISVNTTTTSNHAEMVLPSSRIVPEVLQQHGNKTIMVDSSTETNAYFFYDQFHGDGVMSSGQISPSDTLDSGTCSDLDGTPPPIASSKKNGISVTIIGEQTKRLSSLNSSGTEVDSDDNDNSYDSLHNNNKVVPPFVIEATPQQPNVSCFLPQTLLQDIRSLKLSDQVVRVEEKSYQERRDEEIQKCNDEEIMNGTSGKIRYDSDMYYDFHLNENVFNEEVVQKKTVNNEVDETFAGYKDLLGDGASTIRSSKGTVRGVKNRVRAGIATFLQINSDIKSYKEKDAGKVVVYTTTMGIIRDTYQACMKVKQILRTLLVKFEERDVFMSGEYQQEIRERMKCEHILIPQVYVDGQHVGDAETIEKLNESGELRRILKPFKSLDACTPCKMCGGYRLLPCTVCNGSKKSVHRNHFTAEFVALKCMNCDEVGLIKCTSC